MPIQGVKNLGNCIILIFIILCAVLLGSCDRKGAEELVFAVGGAPSELDFWEELIREFEDNTGIRVRMLRMPANTSQQLQGLVVSLKAGMHDPDVFLMDVAWVGLFAASGWLHPLRDRVNTGPFFDRIIESVDRWDGSLVALPVYMDGGLLYYRKDLLPNGPPRTWQELLDSALRVQGRQRDSNPDFYGFVWTGAQYEGLITVFLEFAGSEGGFVRRGGEIRLNIPSNLRALRFMHDLIWEHRVSPPNTFTDMREEEVRGYFQRGDALYERNWPYAWSLHQAKGSPVRGKTGAAPIPEPETGQGVSTLGGFHIGISGYTDLREQAVRFVRYVTSYETQKRMVLKLGWNPGRQDLYDDPEILEQAPHFRELREVFKHARPRPLVPYYTQVSAIAQRHINRALAGDAEAGEALEAADKEIAALLERYRKD